MNHLPGATNTSFLSGVLPHDEVLLFHPAELCFLSYGKVQQAIVLTDG